MSQTSLQALENLRMRLLDLTGRNRLINFKHTKRGSLRIVDELPNQLVSTLLAEQEMRFCAIPEPTEKELIDAGYLELDPITGSLKQLKNNPNAKEWAQKLGIDSSFETPLSDPSDDSEKHSDENIQTLHFPYELEPLLKNLTSQSESAIQEMGANILYMSFGFLQWYEGQTTENPRIAPLFLLPVQLSKGQLNPQNGVYEYNLKYSGEDIIPNLSLKEKLKADFAIALPELDESTTPEGYFERVTSVILKTKPHWQIKRYITLTLLNFSKLLMYLDLDPERWPENSKITEHSVVSKFLTGPSEEDVSKFKEDFGFGEEFDIDQIKSVHSDYPLIDDADSSQHSALIDALNGKNLVIEGPPGTGKSQTITNIIAAAISQGKKVLFVAEKLAALEVVRDRLDKAGLGEFCLELHSHKSQKRKVLDEYALRIDKRGKYCEPSEIKLSIDQLEDKKTKLNSYAKRINQYFSGTDFSIHEILMAATRYRAELGIKPENFHPEGISSESFSQNVDESFKNQLRIYQKVYEEIESRLDESQSLEGHPWYGVTNSKLQLFDVDNVVNLLNSWTYSLERCIVLQEKVQEQFIFNTQGLEGLHKLLRDLQRIPKLKGDELLESIPALKEDEIAQAKAYIQLFEQIQNQYVQLSSIIDESDLNDLSKIEMILSEGEVLESLIGNKVSFTKLAEALNRLNALNQQVLQLEKPFNDVISALGHQSLEHIVFSGNGLRDFKKIIQFVSDIPPQYLKLRDDLFDNDEIDSILPKYEKDINDLIVQYKAHEEIFELDILPDESRIRKLAKILEQGGLFKWFSLEWRNARNEIKSYSKHAKTNYKFIINSLEDLAKFQEKKRAFEFNADYLAILGEFHQGIHSDLEAIKFLRNWYTEVRHFFGTGFGSKVQIGDEIIGVGSSTAKGVRSLNNNGILNVINEILDDLESLREVFKPVEDLQNPDYIFSGENSLLEVLSTKIIKAIDLCKPLIESMRDTSSISDLADLLDQVGCLINDVDELENLSLNLIGLKADALQIGPQQDNEAVLNSIKHTLNLATVISKDLESDVLTNYIQQNSYHSTYSWLYGISEDLAVCLYNESLTSKDFKEKVLLDEISWFQNNDDKMLQMVERNNLAVQSKDMLDEWLQYILSKDEIVRKGLKKLVKAVERKELESSKVLTAYLAGIFDFLAKEILRNDDDLARFSSVSHREIQSQFSEYDQKLKKLQCEHIAWKADQNNIPWGAMGARVSDKTEMTLLEHEIGKKTRHIPLRQLINRAGNAMASLKPCFMMGPMSVAQYLEPGNIQFDIVVMDEASQIKPQDALGAVARAGQLVVVGDPKQLPPTSFFEKIIDDEEDDPTGIEESESILDATLPIFNSRRLRWHYRSQHESLIAFSNHSFYDSNLVLFPSPFSNSKDFGLQYTRVQRGTFVNRKNLEEARIITETVKEHLKHRSSESLGVVAMSAEQKLQIESTIESYAKQDSVFQQMLDENSRSKKPLFIKNLENVQGDERDVILISMTYGPSVVEGQVYQRFGPINSDVGWRRLNVLFTRSKKRMHIFSSMGAEDILVSNSSKRGVKALHSFLRYCETGEVQTSNLPSDKEPDSDFEIAVIKQLEDAGFECVPQVGVTGFFIDIAVVDPGKPGRYLMGIECDGATYHSAKSARDRDRLRQSVLERLGWKIRRIWSTDWFKNPDGQLKPIIEELHSLKTSASDGLDVTEMSEVEEISVIVEESDKLEEKVSTFISGDFDLVSALQKFHEDVIKVENPGLPESKRLLRPSMIEVFVEFCPTTNAEFLELVPPYLRSSIDSSEGRFLDQVFDIVNHHLTDI